MPDHTSDVMRREDGTPSPVCLTCRDSGLVPNGLPSNGPESCPDCTPPEHIDGDRQP